MRKVIACFLTIALVLFAFTACENKTSTPDTGGSVGKPTIPEPGTTTAPKATTEQLFLLQELYRQSFLNMDNAIEGVSLANDVYTFSDVVIDDPDNDLDGTLSGTFKNSETEISINIAFKNSVDGKTYTVSGTIERNGKDAEITVNGEKRLIHKYQVPPYQNPTPSIPKATKNQFDIYTEIFLYMHSINTSATPPEGFTKVTESYFLYENVKVLDKDGNEGILNGMVLSGAYLNLTYEEVKGGINTIITFFEGKSSEPNTYIVFINGEACTVTLG